MKKASLIYLLAGIILLAAMAPSHAAAPRKINYQGYLTNPAGSPLTGTYSIVFSLYNAATGGNWLWTETQSVPVDKGIFNVALGAATPLTLTFDTQYFLDIQVEGQQMTTRQPLTSVGYAFQADAAATATTAGNVTGTVAIVNGGTGATSASAALNNLLPSQTGNGGKVLSTDGSGTVSWISAGGGADTTAPTPGNSGAITANRSGTDIVLSWTAASDSVTPQSNLEYTVVYSTANNIGTVGDAEANGTVAGISRASNITSKTISGINAATTYYCNVIVSDAALNKSVYTTVVNAPASFIAIYGAETAYDGNLGGRSGADAICNASANKPAGYSHYAAFLSVSSSDSISGRQAFSGLDTSLPIRSTNGTLIASNWSDLLDGTISNTLASAGVSVSTGFWWSGSNSDGTAGLTCSGWTSNAAAPSGGSPAGDWGTNGNTGSLWINPGSVDRTYCDEPTNVLCIAW